jgi:hypothetical protein
VAESLRWVDRATAEINKMVDLLFISLNSDVGN